MATVTFADTVQIPEQIANQRKGIKTRPRCGCGCLCPCRCECCRNGCCIKPKVPDWVGK